MSTLLPPLPTLQHYILNLPTKKKNPYLSVLDKMGSIKDYSSQHYYDQIEKVAKALMTSGFQKGDTIALLAPTRHEWSICELAIISIGGIVVPLYPNTTSEDLAFILNHSECKGIFTDNRTSLRQILLIKDNCPQLKNIIVFDPPVQQEPGSWISFNEFLSGAAQEEKKQSFNFEFICQQAKATDIVTILYTSGTTGQPKGVVLTHQHIISETIEAFAALQLTSADHTLSFLPYSHVLGRTEHWGHLIIGYHMTYSAGIERLTEELPLIQPTVIVAVPRIFEKIYTALKAKTETSVIDNKLLNWAYEIGLQISEKKQSGEPIHFKLKAEHLLAQKTLFDRLKAQLFGSRLRFAVSGGAPLNPDIIQFFHICGILILEGYGLTESTGAICVNRPYDYEFGSVGKPLNQTKIKLAKDGEILIQGPTVLQEYYKDPSSTAEVLEKGWLHSGDIGEVSSQGNLIIKDRKKDLIKTANGKYVAPQKIEGMFKSLPYISHAHIHGDQRNYIVALLTLNKNEIFRRARENNITFRSMEDLKETSFVKDLVRSGVAQINLKLASHESIKNYAVLTEDFSVDSGEITPSLKTKRRIIDQKYKKIIDSLY